jgi:hypothetical protein
MRRQIDEDGAILMASPPRPLVHAHRLEGEGNGTGAAYTSRRRVDGLVDSCRGAACRAPACRPRARPIAWSAATSRWV